MNIKCSDTECPFLVTRHTYQTPELRGSQELDLFACSIGMDITCSDVLGWLKHKGLFIRKANFSGEDLSK